jgi:hypothetical protein
VKNGRPQAKDIDPRELLLAIRTIGREKQNEDGTEWVPWVLIWDLEKLFPFPWKVILSKCQSLIDRGLLDGCTCGCRGDFELTADGEKFLDR